MIGGNISDWSGENAEEMGDIFSAIFDKLGSYFGIFSTGFDKKSRIGFSFGGFVEHRLNDS